MKPLKLLLKGEIQSLYLFAFLIPLNPKWYGFCLLLIVLESILKFKRLEKVKIKDIISYKNPFIWLVGFYVFHIIGLLNTSNFGFANMDLGMKSTFVIFPLYFTLFRPKLNLTKLFQFFLYGSLFSLILYGVLGVVQYFQEGAFPIGSDFSFWMHRGYYATYLVLAFTFLFTEIIRKGRPTILNVTMLLLLLIGTVVTESKAGILIIVINALFLLFYFLRMNIGWLKSTVVMLLISLIAVVSIFKILSENNRFSGALYNLQKENLDITSTESTTARILMWDTAAELISENMIMGVGTGDVKDELQSLNYEKGYTGVADHNLNAHNQFLNSWVALGIFGFIALLTVFITLFVTRDYDNMLFIRLLSVTLFLMFLTESFLEVQAGIIPFAFFISCIGQVRSKIKML